MDFRFIFGEFSMLDKLDFIIKKYFLLLKHIFIPFKIGESKIKIFGKTYYYESNLGLVLYQVSLIHHAKLIDNLDINKQGVVMVDVGANVGCFSLTFKNIFTNSRIYSFEPAPAVFDCLSKNMEGFENVRLENFGLSDTSGIFKFLYNPKNTEMGQISSEGNIDVQIKTLNSYVAKNKISHIDFLKIDTETYEKNVLIGGSDILSKTKYILLEVNYEPSNNNYTVSELMSTLVSKDYNFQLLKIVNFLDKDIEKASILDFLLINKLYEEK